MIRNVKFSSYMTMTPGETFYVRGVAGRIEETWDVLQVRLNKDESGTARIRVTVDERKDWLYRE